MVKQSKGLCIVLLVTIWDHTVLESLQKTSVNLSTFADAVRLLDVSFMMTHMFVVHSATQTITRQLLDTYKQNASEMSKELR